jgi:hypothetical protein
MNARDKGEEKAGHTQGEAAGEDPAAYVSRLFKPRTSKAFRTYLQALQKLGEASEVLCLAEGSTKAREEFGKHPSLFEGTAHLYSALQVAEEEWEKAHAETFSAAEAFAKEAIGAL